MKVLMISTDRKIFEENSEVRQRMVEYGKSAEELHIIVFSLQSSVFSQKFSNVFVYPTNSRSRWFYIFDAIKFGYRIVKEIKNNKNAANNRCSGYLLISSQDPFECGLVGYFLAKKFRVPLQLQIHTDFLSSYFKRELILNRIRVLIAKFLIPRAACIRVVSKRIKNSILVSAKAPSENRLSLRRPRLRFSGGTFAPTITVLPIFVDVQKIKNSPIKTDLHKKYPQFDFIILMASRLTREKNIKMAIETIRKIAKRYPKVGLVIVGSGPEEKNYALRVTRYGLRNNVIIEPWIDDLISYFKTADLFLLTSNYEGYGRTVVEAMAANCPVLMTDVGLAGEILKDRYNGLVVPIGDSESLKKAILEIINNRTLGPTLAASAEKTIELFFSKEKYLEEYLKSWQSCKLKI